MSFALYSLVNVLFTTVLVSIGDAITIRVVRRERQTALAKLSSPISNPDPILIMRPRIEELQEMMEVVQVRVTHLEEIMRPAEKPGEPRG